MENMCVKIKTWWDWKQVNKELQLYKYGLKTYLTYCLSKSTSVTFLTEYNITISLHVFVFSLHVEQDIAFIHDAVTFFLHVCVFCVTTAVFRG